MITRDPLFFVGGMRYRIIRAVPVRAPDDGNVRYVW